MLKIVIRDDDLNYNTRVEELEKAYGKYLGKIPISFSTVPFIHGSQEKMQHIQAEDNSKKIKLLKSIEKNMNMDEIGKYYYKYYSISDNRELVDYMKKMIKNNKAEIMLHGITHRYYSFGAEFSGQNILSEDIEIAKKYLEDVFDTKVRSFVPPSNSFNVRYLETLNNNNINLVISSSLKCRNYKEKLKLYLLKIKYVLKSIYSRKNKTLYDWKYKMISVLPGRTFKVNDTKESFLERCKPDIDKLGYIIISTHYESHLDDEYRTNFLAVLKYFEDINAEFVTMEQLIETLNK